MKPYLPALLAVASATALSAPARAVAPAQGAPLRIMPIGDSRVAGNPPSHESYRYDLWQGLRAGGWSFDFVGPQFDDSTYPGADDALMDRDHFGIGGMRAQIMRTLLPATLATMEAPDVALIGIGGNDLKSMPPRPVAFVVNDVVAMIDALQAANPSVTIFLELIAPGRSDLSAMGDLGSRHEAFITALAPVAGQETTSTSIVTLVDIADGWSDAFMADQTHYNSVGAALVASRYLQALEAHFGPGGDGPASIGTPYCSTAPNSTGERSTLRATGLLSVAVNDVTLEATSLPPGVFGLFLVSRTQGFVPNAGGSVGNLCLGGAIGRYALPGQILDSGPSGIIAFPLDLTRTPQFGGLVAVEPGDTWSYQVWHRDVVGSAQASNTSQGLEISYR